MTEQLRLYGDTVPVAENWVVNLDDLPPNEELVGPEPTAAFVRSVQHFGVIEPIIVIADEDLAKVRVLAGRRRIKAARLVGLEEIPALRYGLGDINAESVALIENEQRSQNDVASLEMIETLLAKGSNINAICDATGMAKRDVERVLALGNLHPGLLEALKGGRMTPSAAFAATKLSRDQQEEVAIRSDGGRITGATIAAARQVKAQKALAGLQVQLLAAERSDAEKWMPLYEQTEQLRTTLAQSPEVPDAVWSALEVLSRYALSIAQQEV